MKNLIRKFAIWLLYLSSEKISDPINNAVFQAFCEVGLNKEDFHKDFDLLKAGKLVDVLHIAGRKLGTDPELNTVGDVIKWLKE